VSSLRARLFVAIALSILLSIGVTLGVGVVLTRSAVRRSAVTQLAREADLLAVKEQTAPLTGPQLRAVRTLLRRQGERLLILTAAAGGALLPDPIRAALEAGTGAEGSATVEGVDVLYAIRPAGDESVLLLRGARLGASDWRPFFGGFLVAGLVGAALAAVASLLLARAIVRPVRRVADASRRLAAGQPPGHVPVEGSDELAVLSASFNEMAHQLATAREAEQSFLLSVSHELKTPLTAIRGYAEGLEEGAVDPREAGEVMSREGVRLARLVQDLLDLARLNQRAFAVRREPVDAATIAREAVLRFEPRAQSFGVSLEAEGEEGAEALGDADRILQVVSNLVENALRVTPTGGRVAVRAAPGELSVSDTGPGLAPEEVPRAFERFFLYTRYRGERAVGTGLGLAIVKELTEAMGGTVAVRSAPGQGTTFTVRLPTVPETDRRAESVRRPAPR
jgi:signal transduction histidine kinase